MYRRSVAERPKTVGPSRHDQGGGEMQQDQDFLGSPANGAGGRASYERPTLQVLSVSETLSGTFRSDAETFTQVSPGVFEPFEGPSPNPS
jgi:hypothetical protein